MSFVYYKMILKIDNIADLDKQGVYLIKNLITNKVYIGSTKSFKKRFSQHKSKLQKNKHGTPHLQNAWNKYGGDNFEFSILEITNENLIEKEKKYISKYKSCNRLKGYNSNSNPELPCSFEKEVKDKISKTLKRKYNSKEISSTSGCFKKKNIPWNKGIKYKDTSFMKKPKTITEDLKKAWENTSKRNREKANIIQVIDKNNNLLYQADCLIELIEWSNTENNNLPIISKFGKKLDYSKVSKACKSSKLYKGLYFKSIKSPINK